MRPSVKFNKKGQALVKVAYKHGEVTWALTGISNTGKFDWILFEKPDNYNPDRVTNDHKYILSGKKLRAQLISTAAASHSFIALDALKKALKTQRAGV
jgi:hypothetical protein